MSIKATKTPRKHKVCGYPKLMIGRTTKNIWLVTAIGKGTLLKVGQSTNPVGHVSSRLTMGYLLDYNESLILTND